MHLTRLFDFLNVRHIDPDSPTGAARLGASARFSSVLADFENVTRRGRLIPGEEGRIEFAAGRDRGR